MSRAVFLALCVTAGVLRAESGYDAWLRYAPIEGKARGLPAAVVTLDDSPVMQAARDELIRGVRGMLGRTLRAEKSLPPESAIVLATAAALHNAAPEVHLPGGLIEDGYCLKTAAVRRQHVLLIAARNDRGVLYGAFALLRKIALHEGLTELNEQRNPFAPIRWTNEWDNLDGSIERGYAGRSIFFENNNVAGDLSRVRDYARLLASIGINSCTINNVNANPRAITSEFLPQLARVADVFRPWGLRLSLSVDFGSPKTAGGLDTFDPLDPRVAGWWEQKVSEIYRAIPDLAGFVVKADSEGRSGPSAYGRTHADAANVIARALKPHGGILLYRGFVYDHHMDWRNLKNDRARAAYDNFQPLDGRFDDNAVVQIKYGPIDFQVREPVSPLFGALKHTNEAVEFQITQEYTGQQRHLCYLAPMWKEIVSGLTFTRPLGGFVGVSNVGRDANWLGNDLAMANLYAFGRMAWDPGRTPARIVDEWTRLTFGDDARVVETIVRMQLESWRAYENYTGPLGAGTLTDILHSHYGPNVEASERNGWGQWHRADQDGIGMDRTVATGTGFIGQYPPAVARLYESLEKCPDELLLFMHHVPYSHVLHSGKTVIQHIYDSHYEGAATAAAFPERWKQLRGRIDDDRYHSVLAKLEYQAGHAIEWRDDICNWFLRTSGIFDAKGRVGHHPDRTEAESMTLDGYSVEKIFPSEAASGGKVVSCALPKCSASFIYAGESGWRDVAVRYFDQNNGESRFTLFVGDQMVDEWVADDRLPSSKPDADSSSLRKITRLALRPGDVIRLEGAPDRGERAAVDYISVTPNPSP